MTHSKKVEQSFYEAEGGAMGAAKRLDNVRRSDCEILHARNLSELTDLSSGVPVLTVPSQTCYSASLLSTGREREGFTGNTVGTRPSH